MSLPPAKRSRRKPVRQTDRHHSRQRFGRITGREPFGSGGTGRQGTYFVTEDETGGTFSFDYSDIVTEGFRTIRTGERVRFLTSTSNPGRASYVIRLDLPEVEDFYRTAFNV